ncbi:Rho termination factor N-terminal domain-containing protein, partial [Frankia sp. Cas4]|uniref:Rho termination factor N-terminal domain-containing protein n=1 Tax=Frankia sp. Cas4 TaxID=3073927 RepID=UPI002AD269FF
MSDTTDVLPDSARESAESQTPTSSVDAGSPRRRRSGTGLSAMLLPELQAMATSLGIQGVGRLRKGQLIAAIQNVQTPAGVAGGADAAAPQPAMAAADAQPARSTRGSSTSMRTNTNSADAAEPTVASSAAEATAAVEGATRVRTRRGASRASGSPSTAVGEQGTLTEALPDPGDTRGGAAASGPADGSASVRAVGTQDATAAGTAPAGLAAAPAPAPAAASAPAAANALAAASAPAVVSAPSTPVSTTPVELSVAAPTTVPRVSDNGSVRGRDDRRDRQQVEGDRASVDRPVAAERQGRQQGDRQGR